MALITCPDCNAQVSDRAAACLKCGAPIAAARADVTVTEQTGKGHKFAQLVGGVMVAVGFALLFTGTHGVGAALAGIGLVVFLIARFSAWWSHG